MRFHTLRATPEYKTTAAEPYRGAADRRFPVASDRYDRRSEVELLLHVKSYPPNTRIWYGTWSNSPTISMKRVNARKTCFDL